MVGCGRKIGEFDCCTIIHGDCDEYLWQLPAGIVDLVVTDPPYGMSFVSGARKEKYDAIVGDDRLPVETIQQLIQIPRLASYFYMRWDNLWEHETLPKPKSVLTWVKKGTGMGDLEHEHGRATEVAIFYPGPEHGFCKRPSDVLNADRTGNVSHPTQKPLHLIKQMLEWYTSDKKALAAFNFQTVLDPYMGCGTTAIAAMQLKKHFLGFEIDPTHYKTATERIETMRGRPVQVDGGFDFDGQSEGN